jgi:2-oxoglutarate ferredoxin oxidoreductase subunit gamma
VNLTRLAMTPWARLAAVLDAVARRLPADAQPIVLSSLPGPLHEAPRMPFSFVHGPAGRNIALAVGLRAARPRTPLVLVMNADGVTLGTNHLIHAARRNVGMTLLLLRAELTKNEGSLDRTSWNVPDYQREIEPPARPLEWVSALEAALVGRANLDDAPSVGELVLRAIHTPGFGVIGITTDASLRTGVLSESRYPEYFESYRDWARPLREVPHRSAAPTPSRRPRNVPRYEVRIAGLGGHGVKLAGTVLSEAAGFHEGLWATQRGDYGSATRGGPSSVDVVIGSDPITYAGADHPDALVVLSQAACDRHAKALKHGARLVADPADVTRMPEGALAVPITALAREHTGKPIAAGVVALGCIAALTDTVSEESLRRSLAAHVPRALEENIAACAAGFAATRAALASEGALHG